MCTHTVYIVHSDEKTARIQLYSLFKAATSKATGRETLIPPKTMLIGHLNSHYCTCNH